MSTRHLDRLMNRASVAVMAAFAPKPDTSSVPAFAERIDDDGGAGDDGSADGLSAAEQAEFDAMRRGEAGGDREAGADRNAGDGDGEGADADADGMGDAGDDADDRDAGEPDAGAGDARTDKDAQADPAKRRPKTIAYGRYQRERAEDARKLKEATEALQREKEQRARLDERTRMLAEAFKARDAAPAAAEQQQEDPDPEPNRDEDPIGHLEWRNRKLEATVNELRTGQQQRETREQAQTAEQALFNDYTADLENAAQADSSYADAFATLRDSRFYELGMIFAGIDVNDAAECAKLSTEDQQRLSTAIQQSFANEQLLVAREAKRLGKRPSEIVMGLAKARGFQKKAAPAPAVDPAADAAAPVPVKRAPGGKVPSVKDEIANIREGQAAARSLSEGGGSPGGGLPDLSRLADMPDDEFEAVYNEIRGNPKASAQFDRSLGKVPL